MKACFRNLSFAVIFFLSFCAPASAGVGHYVTVSGEIENLNGTQVELRQKEGIAVVPRSAFDNKQELRPGMKVKARVLLRDLKKIKLKKNP